MNIPNDCVVVDKEFLKNLQYYLELSSYETDSLGIDQISELNDLFSILTKEVQDLLKTIE